MKQDKKSKN